MRRGSEGRRAGGPVHLLAALASAVVLAGALGCGDSGSRRAGLSDEAHDPTSRGPFPVGVRTLTFVDESRYDRPSKGSRILTTEVWYPAVEQASAGPTEIVLDFIPDRWVPAVQQAFRLIFGPGADESLEAPTGAVRDVPIDRVEGPYPLVGFSHGNGSVRFQNYTQCEHLASHGFVVFAPDHIGNSAVTFPNDSIAIFNPLLIPKSFFDRVLDMRFLVDRFLDLDRDGPGGFFTGTVRGAPAGVMGHSFGGTTAMALPSIDPRVGATLPMAGVYVPVLVPPLEIPSLLMYAAEDKTIGEYGIFTNQLIHALSVPPKLLIRIPDAGHYTFSDGCTFLPALFEGDGCGEGVRFEDGSTFEFLPQAEGFAIMNSYAVAFFGWTLKGQDEMLEFLRENRFPQTMELGSVLGEAE